MALIDFHELVNLYKQARGDVGFLSNHFDPPPMSVSPPPRSISPSVGGSQPNSVQLQPTTLARNPNRTTRSGPDITPPAKETAVQRKQELDTDRIEKHDTNDYRQFIVQDFERHRVFVDIDVFMKHVLQVPDDWVTQWGSTIEEIKADDTFSLRYTDYRRQCNIHNSREELLYGPLTDMVSAILDVARQSPLEPTKPTNPQRYVRVDPKKLHHGVINEAGLSPDIISIHEDLHSNLQPLECVGRRLKQSFLTWAQPLHVLEVKPFDATLVDGSWMPRLKANGQDPKANHAHPPANLRYSSRKPPAIPAISTLRETNSTPPEVPRKTTKRPSDQSSEPNRETQKRRLLNSTPSGTNAQALGKTHQSTFLPQSGETIRQKEAYIQVGKYLLEQFSIPALRSHATVGLIDRDRIQFYHANHSVILVSSAINFGENNQSDGLNRLIAIVIAFSRLSLRENGILHNLCGSKLFRDNEILSTACFDPKTKATCIQRGKKLEFEEGGKPFTLTFGDVIHHEPSLVGRSTAVLHATSPKWKGTDLVVKINWPGVGRSSESEFLKKAIEEAEATPNKWALKHLPGLLFDQDVLFDSDSTPGKVASMFENAEFVDGEYKYEQRVLRIIVQERLYPLKTLTDIKEIAQVLLDVACIHRWLYEKVGILHRDPSLNNMMYRKTEQGEVYGVLTDFDLSSWTADLTSTYARTSQQRTGTPPYMASGLLLGTDPLHLYRHDVESIFYVMLMLATHHEIYIPEKRKKKKKGGVRMRRGFEKLPFQEWFEQPIYETLGSVKNTFLTSAGRIDLSPSFEDLRDWLKRIRRSFRLGISARVSHDGTVEDLEERSEGSTVKMPDFDYETLGGHVCYSALIDPARNLGGKLGGLIIRYESDPTFSNMASTSATQADG